MYRRASHRNLALASTIAGFASYARDKTRGASARVGDDSEMLLTAFAAIALIYAMYRAAVIVATRVYYPWRSALVTV